MGTRSPQRLLTPSEARRLAELDAVIAQARLDTLDLLEAAEDVMAEIDDLLVERPFLIAFAQWEGE